MKVIHVKNKRGPVVRRTRCAVRQIEPPHLRENRGHESQKCSVKRSAGGREGRGGGGESRARRPRRGTIDTSGRYGVFKMDEARICQMLAATRDRGPSRSRFLSLPARSAPPPFLGRRNNVEDYPAVRVPQRGAPSISLRMASRTGRRHLLAPFATSSCQADVLLSC